MKKTKMILRKKNDKVNTQEYTDFGCQEHQVKEGAQNIDLAPKGQLVREYAGQIDRW